LEITNVDLQLKFIKMAIIFYIETRMGCN
jgi:hypothetical protein